MQPAGSHWLTTEKASSADTALKYLISNAALMFDIFSSLTFLPTLSMVRLLGEKGLNIVYNKSINMLDGVKSMV